MLIRECPTKQAFMNKLKSLFVNISFFGHEIPNSMAFRQVTSGNLIRSFFPAFDRPPLFPRVSHAFFTFLLLFSRRLNSALPSIFLRLHSASFPVFLFTPAFFFFLDFPLHWVLAAPPETSSFSSAFSSISSPRTQPRIVPI